MELRRINSQNTPEFVQPGGDVPWSPNALILARTITAAIFAALTLALRFTLKPAIQYPWLWGIAGTYAAISLSLWALSSRGDRAGSPSPGITASQSAVDIIALTLFLHFSGGVANPFFIAYPLMAIPFAALLPKRPAWLLAGFAATLFTGMVLLESTGIIPHYRLIRSAVHTSPVYVATALIAVAAGICATTALILHMAEHLRSFRLQCDLSIAERTRVEMEKTHFLDVVAHDLKSPLSAIETMVSSILDAYGSEMNEDTRDTLERIPRRTRDLIRFIQNLLDFSRIRGQESLKEQFRPLNFLPVVTSTVEMYMDQALDKNITLTIQAEPNLPLLSGSREHLERMVANLISNAVRYTPDGGSIKVKLAARDNEIALSVADSGIGIPEKDLPRVFEEFYRASNARISTSSGTGLGLPIAKFIVEKHGGSISVNSVEGEGTVFTVRIPVAPAKQSAGLE